MKQKRIAAVLAFFLGIFGVHRLYLGQRLLGLLHLAFAIFAFIITIEEGVPLIAIPALIGFIDSVLFAVMPREEFDDKYNARYMQKHEEEEEIPWQNWSHEEIEDMPEEGVMAQAVSFAEMPPPAKPEPENEDKLSLDLLEQLSQYGKLKDQGLLTEEEFEELKKRIL